MATPTVEPPIAPISPNHVHDPRTYAIIGASLEVHQVLGCGYLERGYQLALANELTRRGIPFNREVEMPMRYKGDLLDCSYRVDFVCFDDVIVELKAVQRLGAVEAAQVLNYLKLSGFRTGLLFNFGSDSLETKRFVM